MVLIKALVILAVAILIDGTLFDGMNVNRIFATFSVSEEALEAGEP